MRNNKGITLIALVITIIVMLILVAVTITMAVNGGLFTHAGKAAGDTQNAINAEQELANLPANMTTDQLIAKYTTGQGGNGGGSTPVTTIGTKSDGIVTINGEQFFDITDYVSSATDVHATADSTKYILLAKNCLNIDSSSSNYHKQDSTYGTLAYSGSIYWTYTGGAPWIYNSSSSLYSHVEAYVTSLKGSNTTADITGRILSKGEADLLAGANGNTNILYTNASSEGTGINYWLGSADPGNNVWSVYGEDSDLDRSYYGNGSLYGVRPVIEISRSLIS